MIEDLMTILHLLSVTISVLMLAVTFKWPNLGRFLFVLLFLWAAYINSKTAFTDPNDYLNYAQFAWLDFYRDFINGVFAQNTVIIVLSIAACQLIISVLLAARGEAVKWGSWGGIMFLLAIAPLGIGSGFPSTLIMAASVYLISRKSFKETLWQMARSRFSMRRVGGAGNQ